jgi:hypothetical protein
MASRRSPIQEDEEDEDLDGEHKMLSLSLLGGSNPARVFREKTLQ